MDDWMVIELGIYWGVPRLCSATSSIRCNVTAVRRLVDVQMRSLMIRRTER